MFQKSSSSAARELAPTVFLFLALAYPAGGQEETAPGFYARAPLLRELIDEALAGNPAIQESYARFRAVEESVVKERALPDPTFVLGQAIRPVETRVGPQYTSFTLSQRLPWFGKRDLQGKLVAQEAAALFQLFRVRQREVIARVKQTYYELGYIDTALEITGAESSLVEHYGELALTRYATGRGLQAEPIRLQAEGTKIRHRRELLRERRRALVARINSLLDRSLETEIPLIPLTSLPKVRLEPSELLALGEAHQEELKAAEALIGKGEHRLQLAQKKRWPDVTLGFSFINVGERNDPGGMLAPPEDDGKNAFNLSVGVSLPFSGAKYDGEIREAREALSAERHRYQSMRNQMELSLTEEVLRLETLGEQIELFEKVLLTQAEEALGSMEAAYETGRTQATDLLDSERSLLEVRLAAARFHFDFLKALASIEQAIGTPFPEGGAS